MESAQRFSTFVNKQKSALRNNRQIIFRMCTQFYAIWKLDLDSKEEDVIGLDNWMHSVRFEDRIPAEQFMNGLKLNSMREYVQNQRLQCLCHLDRISRLLGLQVAQRLRQENMKQVNQQWTYLKIKMTVTYSKETV